MPAASSGASSPLSAASTASFRTAVMRTLIETDPRPRASRWLHRRAGGRSEQSTLGFLCAVGRRDGGRGSQAVSAVGTFRSGHFSGLFPRRALTGSIDKTARVWGVATKADILGTKLRYSGGAVGPFALFTMNGELECSGNVYDYGGSIPAEKFQQELRHFNPDPAKQYISLRGGCRVPVKH